MQQLVHSALPNTIKLKADQKQLNSILADHRAVALHTDPWRVKNVPTPQVTKSMPCNAVYLYLPTLLSKNKQ